MWTYVCYKYRVGPLLAFGYPQVTEIFLKHREKPLFRLPCTGNNCIRPNLIFLAENSDPLFKGTVSRDLSSLRFFHQTASPGPSRGVQKRFNIFSNIHEVIRIRDRLFYE
jgi:hypothetical protein